MQVRRLRSLLLETKAISHAMWIFATQRECLATVRESLRCAARLLTAKVIPVFECTAKDCSSVENVFVQLARMMLEANACTSQEQANPLVQYDALWNCTDTAKEHDEK
jgi:hypothetical protein